MEENSHKYYLFLDECGDQNLANFDPSFPIFTLCGIIVSEQEYLELEKQINKLKSLFWADKKIILHSRDIRKCQNGYEVLFDLNKKKLFYEKVNHILSQPLYRVISCSIKKEEYIRQYGRLNDVYAQSLSFIIERSVFYLDSLEKSKISLTVDVEKRGKREDALLLRFYNELLDRGTYYVSPKRIKNYFKRFEMHWKWEDIVGLQVADLVAYPITRHILSPNSVNMAYDVLAQNIYADSGKIYGLKVFP